ncbi:MAG: ComEA family DNA-binding protein, partial [Flavobacteriaceae bacterium]
SFLFSRYSGERTVDEMKGDALIQSRIDSLKEEKIRNTPVGMAPFNPNFISDYKGYVLGMSPGEIDRLHAFRAQNTFVNSKEEFQEVTQVSDSLLNSISPYFKFPEWVTKGKSESRATFGDGSTLGNTAMQRKKAVPVAQDLNRATAEELRVINGIGEVLSNRIVKFRTALGGFLVDEQLYDVYGLEPEVAERALQRFKVRYVPNITPIHVNTASVWELSKLPYLQKEVAQAIVDYRNANGLFNSFDELQRIEGFPSNKIDRIKLYLQL